MKTFVQMVYEAEVVSGKLDKADCLKGLSAQGQRLVMEALSPYRVFNVKQFDMPTRYAKADAGVSEFFRLLDKLHSRQLTGEAARKAIRETLSLYTKPTAKALERVLIKNLRIGATAKTFNKLYPKLVPTFDMALANVADGLEEIVYPKLAEIKYDGMRNIAIVEPSGVQHLSRKGLHQVDFEVFDADCLKLATFLRSGPVVLDGEVRSSSFQKTMERGSARELLFYVFDFLPLAEWEKQHSTRTQMERREQLARWLSTEGGTQDIDLLRLSTGETVRTAAQAQKFFDKHKPAGFTEGLMMKDLYAPYTWGRSDAWLKWKPVQTYDLEVVGWEYGKSGGKHAKTVGALVCKGQDEQGRPILTNVGGGLSDELRTLLLAMANAGKLEGKWIEATADAMTKAKNSDTWSLRFPRFYRFRDDK